jgi:hypothetical protein
MLVCLCTHELSLHGMSVHAFPIAAQQMTTNSAAENSIQLLSHNSHRSGVLTQPNWSSA